MHIVRMESVDYRAQQGKTTEDTLFVRRHPREKHFWKSDSQTGKIEMNESGQMSVV